MSSPAEKHCIPVITALDNGIMLVDYSVCTEINSDSLAFARTKIPLKADGTDAVDVLLNLKGTRSYNVKLMEVVTTHREFNVGRAAWLIEGRIAGFLSRMFGGGSVLRHKVALFEEYDEALDWLRHGLNTDT